MTNNIESFSSTFGPIKKDTSLKTKIGLDIFLFAALALIPTGFGARKCTFIIGGGFAKITSKFLVEAAGVIAEASMSSIP